jgi:hypothetical protein
MANLPDMAVRLTGDYFLMVVPHLETKTIDVEIQQVSRDGDLLQVVSRVTGLNQEALWSYSSAFANIARLITAQPIGKDC